MSDTLPESWRVEASQLLASARDSCPRWQLDWLAGRDLPRAGGLARPRSLDELVEVVRTAHEDGVTLVPIGALSGVCAGVAAAADTVLLDLKALDDLRLAPGRAVCGPGVMGRHLEDRLNRVGLTAGHFPSSISCSSVGGWVAARGAGQLSSRYGKIEDILVGATGVTVDGRVVRAHRGDPALMQWCGSEGTLVALAELELRVRPLREGWTLRGFEAPDLETALELARDLMRLNPVPSVLRVYDPIDTRIALRKGKGGGTARLAKLVMNAPRLARWAIDSTLSRCLVIAGWEGDGPVQQAALATARNLAGALDTQDLGDGPGQTWLAKRHAVSFKQMPVVLEGLFADTFEVACPWGLVERVYKEVTRAVSPVAVGMCHFSHAYHDGCAAYFSFAGLQADYEETWRRALDAADAVGATITHHHGVGRLKAAWLPRELGGLHPVLVELKRQADPDERLNPGGLGLGGSVEGTPAREPGPHPWPDDGCHDDDALWIGPADACIGEVEQGLRDEGWTVGASTACVESVLAWLRQDLVGPSASSLGSARERLVALAGERDGLPYASRIAPRTAAGPWLLAAALDSDVQRVALRLAPRPERFRRLLVADRAALRDLLVGDVEPFAVRQAGDGYEVWLSVDTLAESIAHRALGVHHEGEPPEGHAVARWRPWDELDDGAVLVGAGPAGAWEVA